MQHKPISICSPHFVHNAQATKFSFVQCQRETSPIDRPSNSGVHACRALLPDFAADWCTIKEMVRTVTRCWILAYASWVKALRLLKAQAQTAPAPAFSSSSSSSSRGVRGSQDKRPDASRGNLRGAAVRSNDALRGPGAGAALELLQGAAPPQAWGQVVHACAWALHALCSRSAVPLQAPDTGTHRMTTNSNGSDPSSLGCVVLTMKVGRNHAHTVCLCVCHA